MLNFNCAIICVYHPYQEVQYMYHVYIRLTLKHIYIYTVGSQLSE